jgi:hypothetical protein
MDGKNMKKWFYYEYCPKCDTETKTNFVVIYNYHKCLDCETKHKNGKILDV